MENSTRNTVYHRQGRKNYPRVKKSNPSPPFDVTVNPPSLYVLNVAALTKAHAIQHISADILAYNIDIAIISETHLKKKHLDGCFQINGYTLFRRDRIGRRGGGVAVYVREQLSAKEWTSPCDQPDFELLWIEVQAGSRKLLSGHSITRQNPCINLTN